MFLAHVKFLQEAFHLTLGVNQALLTRVKRMALVAQVGAHQLERGTGGPAVAARANHLGGGKVFGVNVRPHALASGNKTIETDFWPLGRRMYFTWPSAVA